MKWALGLLALVVAVGVVNRKRSAHLKRNSVGFRVAFAAIVTSLLASAGFCGAEERFGTARVVKAFEVGPVGAVLCYAELPAFIFARKGQSGGYTIVSLSFDGVERELLHLDGLVSVPSLSCSNDGSVIAVLREVPPKSVDLFILKSGVPSQYQLDSWPINSTRGKTSLLSEDGHSLSLPAEPRLISGPDIIRDMRLFVYSSGNTFFLEDRIVYDREASIEILSNSIGKWKPDSVIPKKSSMYVNSVGHCSGRTLALIADETTERSDVYELSQGKLEKASGIETRGLESPRPGFGSIYAGSSDFGQCIYAVTKRTSPGDIHSPLRGFVVAGRNGSRAYRLVPTSDAPTDLVTLSGNRISITKDGCEALISAFVREPRVPQFTLPQRVLLFKLVGKQNNCL
jgi:hypothetical protein